jgi:hypothetical protein
MEYENPPLLTPAGGRVIMRDDESDENNGMPTSYEPQLSAADAAVNNDIATSLAPSWSAAADCDNELTASIAEAATSSSLPAEKSSPSSPLLTISPSSQRSITASASKKRNKRLSYEWIVAAMIVLLCSSSFHQSSSVVAAAITDPTEVDSVGLSGNSADAAMRMRGATNGIQRKRGVQRITNHRRLDHHRQQLQQRTLQDMCTCSPQIFNVKVTLTPTNPCTTDELKPNLGIENTLCLYNAPPAPPTTASPTPSPVDSSATTAEPTETGTNDPFKPPPPPPKPDGGPEFPTYFPTYSPTKSEEGGRVSSEVLPDGNGSNPRDGSGARGREEEPTFQPTHAWPTFSPTDVPTQEQGGDGGGGKPQGGGRGRGGWLQEGEEEGMLPHSANMDDDELIEPHHHRHHHHHTPLENENGGGRKLLDSNGSRKKRVINVDELVLVQQDDTDEDGRSSSSSDAEKDSNNEIMPPYYQPPAVVSPSTLNTWISIHPNDVFFEKHPELKLHQEEIYRMKHGLSSSSRSKVASSMTRSLQASSGFMPTQLISAQFLEMDTSPNMQIINNDDQYINVTFPDPSNIVLQFSSISNLLNPDLPLSEQMEYVPGGAILILVGTTADGEVVRNRMLWTYTMGCGLEDYTVLDGNVIGWAGFVSMIIYFSFSLSCLVVDGFSHKYIHSLLFNEYYSK